MYTSEKNEKNTGTRGAGLRVKQAALLFCAAFAFSCGGQKTPEVKDTVVYSYPSNAGPVNPHLYSPSQMYAQALVYEGLVMVREDGSVGPSLAESWDISADGRVYTFHLRKGVTFSNGEAFTADAAVKNFKAVMGNAADHDWLGLVDKIESYEAAAPLEFRLTLKSAYYPLLDDLALVRPFRFLSPGSFPDDGNTANGIKAPVGTGPWKLAETKLGEYDVFERNETYWGGKPKPAKVIVKVIPDPVSRALAFESGGIDLIYGQGQIPYDIFNRLKNTEGVGAAISPAMGTVCVALNSAKGPTRELAVRRALQHVTDKREIIHGVTLDTQIPAETYFAPSVPYCNIGLAPYAYDIPKAAALLDEAGWVMAEGSRIREKNGEPLSIDFCFVGNNAAQKAIAEMMQGQAMVCGIGLNLVGEESDSFYTRQNTGEFGMIFNDTWGPPYEPHAMVSSMLVPAHADYKAQIGLPMKAEMDNAIRAVFVTTDAAERQRLYTDILTTLHDQAVYVPLYHMTMFEAHRSAVLRNVRFGPDTHFIPFEDMVLE
jgi:nickel transport system substrate-binding protein